MLPALGLHEDKMDDHGGNDSASLAGLASLGRPGGDSRDDQGRGDPTTTDHGRPSSCRLWGPSPRIDHDREVESSGTGWVMTARTIYHSLCVGMDIWTYGPGSLVTGH